MAETIRVEVVAAEGIAWEGDALSIIARTTEGDVGIMHDHVPFLAALVPSAAEILTTEGTREVVAVDGGFISVADNRVSLLAGYARIAKEIDRAASERELAQLEKEIEDHQVDEQTRAQFHRVQAQVKAAQLAAGERR
jgi:F-type H+-transporting ATPase subunit epsilon